MKSKSFVITLAFIAITCTLFLFIEGLYPGTFTSEGYLLFCLVSIAVLILIPTIFVSVTDSLKDQLSKKKKELLFEKVSHTDETMEGIHSLLEEFKLETKDPHVISSFKIAASKALITKYSLCKTLFNFCKDVSNDESTARTTSDLRDIFASTISANLVQENFKRLFVQNIQEILELQDVERAKVFFQWATEDLHVFNPPKHFAEEIGKLRTLSLKQV